jgi:large subunit ribosomal protein L17
MRHGRKTKKLGRTYEHRRALLRNLARSLFTHGRIRTTVGKAKAARQFVERLISYAKQNSLAARRLLFAHLNDHEMASMVTEKIGPLFATRSGGYTRIYLLGRRLGDGAEMAILELVERPVVEGAEKAKEKKEEKKEAKREAPKTGKKAPEKAEAKKPEAKKPEKKEVGKPGKGQPKKAKEEAKKSKPVARPEKPKKAVSEKEA